MLQTAAPLGLRRRIAERIAPICETGLFQVVAQLAVRHGMRGEACIHAGLIQRQRIKRGKHADVGQNRGVILPVAVAVRGYIHDQRHMEARTPIDDGLGVFRHAAVELLIGGVVIKDDGIKIAGPQASAAAHAVLRVHVHLARLFIKDKAAIGALFLALAASAAGILLNVRLAA